MVLPRTMSSRYAWDDDHRLVPFSKTNKEFHATIGDPALIISSHSGSVPQPKCVSEENPGKEFDQNNEMKLQLPLPPPSCPLKVPNKSNTLKHDPFLLAYKQCTKSRGSSSIKRLFTGLFSRNKKEKKKKKGAAETGSELKISESEFSFQNSRIDVLLRDKSRRLLRSMSIR